MKFLITLLTFSLSFINAYGEINKCEWKNTTGKPCLTIFSAPNTSKITEETVGKTVITKQQMLDSGYQDVRSLLEHVAGVDVYKRQA